MVLIGAVCQDNINKHNNVLKWQLRDEFMISTEEKIAETEAYLLHPAMAGKRRKDKFSFLFINSTAGQDCVHGNLVAAVADPLG